MQHGQEYEAAFRSAAEKSQKWKLIGSVDLRPMPQYGRARDHLSALGAILDTPEWNMNSLEIRLACAYVHSELFKFLWANAVPCVLTIGDVVVDGKPEFKTSYQKLKQEIRGVHTGTDKPISFHVWLTFPDLHIIDATFFIYKYYEKLPEPWRWSDYVMCSDHEFTKNINLQYMPMLIGGPDLIDSMIMY